MWKQASLDRPRAGQILLNPLEMNHPFVLARVFYRHCRLNAQALNKIRFFERQLHRFPRNHDQIRDDRSRFIYQRKSYAATPQIGMVAAEQKTRRDSSLRKGKSRKEGAFHLEFAHHNFERYPQNLVKLNGRVDAAAGFKQRLQSCHLLLEFKRLIQIHEVAWKN